MVKSLFKTHCNSQIFMRNYGAWQEFTLNKIVKVSTFGQDPKFMYCYTFDVDYRGKNYLLQVGQQLFIALLKASIDHNLSLEGNTFQIKYDRTQQCHQVRVKN